MLTFTWFMLNVYSVSMSRWHGHWVTQSDSLMLKKRMLTSWHWGELGSVLKDSVSESVLNVVSLKLLPWLNCVLRFVSRVDLWNASNLKFGDEFLGGVRVPLRVLGQAGVHDAWWEEHDSHITSSLFTQSPRGPSIISGSFYGFSNEQVLRCTPAGAGWVWFHYHWHSEYVLP